MKDKEYVKRIIECFDVSSLYDEEEIHKIIKQIRAEVIEKYKDKLYSTLEECQTGFNMVSMANVWHFSEEIAEQLKKGE